VLADVSGILADLPSADEGVREVLRSLIPRLADWGVVQWSERHGRRQVALAHHVDPDHQVVLERLVDEARPLALVRAMERVVRTGAPFMTWPIGVDDVSSFLARPEHAEPMWELGLTGMVVAPIRSPRRVLGAMLLGTGAHVCEHADLALAGEVARRVGAALECQVHLPEAERALRARERLLAIVSHDLRAPLGTIVVSASNIRRRAARDGTDAFREEAERIVETARRMERLIRDLLDFSQLEVGTLRVERSPEPIASLVRDAVDVARPLAGRLRVSLDLPESVAPVVVSCDRERVLEILDNLIGNAIKFTPEDGDVIVRVRAGDREVTISVEDTGPGLEPAELPHVFEAYRSGPRHTGRGAGVGLGLYIARGLVEAQGGQIRAESEPGLGSAFVFTLPIARGSA
jgi:signal transduction histidine kinase